jgi:two-component system sensor kinase FixL
VSFTLPAIVSVEAAIILWLLTLLAHRSQIAPPAADSAQEDVPVTAAEPPGSRIGGLRLRAWVSRMFADRYAASQLRAMLAPSIAGGDRTGLTPTPQQSAPRELNSDHPRNARRGTTAVRAFRWPTRVGRSCPSKAGEGIPGPSGTAQRNGPQHSGISAHGAGEDGFRELWEAFPFAIVLLDQQGRILMANLRAHSLFGYQSGELPGVSISVLVPEPRESVESTCRDGFLSTLHSLSFGPMRSFVARRKDGSALPLEIGLRQSSFRGQVAILAFMEDKSDHYGLLQNQQDLAHLTRVSTMGALAGSLAHELNQPLTAILSNVQAAQRFMTADPIDVAEVREILNDIVQDDYRASEVIRRIRSVVRKTDMEFAFVDLASVIREVVVLLYSEAIMRGARITLQPCAELPAVYADKVQLQQVILNLLLNAFDAMSHVSPGERVVSIEVVAQGDDTVLMAVRDCGHGLTVGKLDTVFKPFHTSKPQGLGLGLSISRSIVELHGGRIWAENNINRGATFFVSLPRGNAARSMQSR